LTAASWTSAIPESTALLDIAFLPGGVAVFAADRSGVEARWANGAQSSFEDWGRQFMELCASPHSDLDELNRLGRILYDNLIFPFERRLLANQVLIIQADGLLQSLPWAALQDRQRRVLLDRVAVVIGSELHAARRATYDTGKSGRPLVIAEPALSLELASAFPPLSDSLLEAGLIKKQFPEARVLSGSAATVEAVKEYLPTSTFFHFGGHGLAHGGYGAMLLSSNAGAAYTGVLAAPEIAEMDLRRVRVVSLAACSTGVGQALGPVNPESLVRSLLDAGAQNVIAASWAVDSRSTADVFAQFYAHWAGRLRLPDALRNACLRVRSRPESAHPYYWAGFQLYGSPD
jgi:CHAT domain-containing protein